MSQRYVDIIIDISHEAIDRPFQYEIPENLQEHIKLGMQVQVPFGKGNKARTGYVIGFSDTPKFDVTKIKKVIGVYENRTACEGQLLTLAFWMAEQYGSTIYQALSTVMPVKKVIRPVEKKTIALAVTEQEGRTRLLEYQRKHNSAKARLLEALLVHGEIPAELAKDKLNITAATYNRLEQEGTVDILTTTKLRDAKTKRVMTTPEPELNERQQAILDRFAADYNQENYKTYLLHGVTGSGKTEVYMHAIDVVIAKGKQAIVLIPEISLTFQTVMRFRRHFGERITILNSKMSDGERYDQYLRIKNGEVDIVIGPRSALFAPFSNLGLIVIDEEHEASYKSDNMPKFHARDVAIKRASMCGASVILGSATPSLNSYYHAKQGDYVLFELTQRAASDHLATTEIVDMRSELHAGNRSRYSMRLRELIEDRLNKGQQTILFINRRGYATFVSCRNCGEVVRCEHCQVSLTYHDHNARIPKLVCHYCGHEEPFVKKCKKCGSTLIGKFGAGTEAAAAELQQIFPQAKILRMDADTTRGKDDYDKILSAFADQKADILIGTQMVVKGHDFANVTLVGVLAADLSLYTQDYMAGERTFDLITQAEGRAGRGKEAGIAVIQTYSPEEPVILASAAQNYTEFYENEIAYRKLLQYPPVSHMLAILVTSPQEETAERTCQAIVQSIEENDEIPKQVRFLGQIDQEGQAEKYDQADQEAAKEQTKEAAKEQAKAVRVIGPSTPVIGKIKDIYRRLIYIKSADYDTLIRVKNAVDELYGSKVKAKDYKVYFDFDPIKNY